MKNIIILSIILIAGTITGLAQSNMVVSGSTTTGSNGTATYTLGQIEYKTYDGASGTVSQGMQQPFEISTWTGIDLAQIKLIAGVYPNPTFGNVILAVDKYDFTNLKYQLYDINGKIILIGKVKQNKTEIEMSSLPSASYFLKITDNKNILKTFKIIKSH